MFHWFVHTVHHVVMFPVHTVGNVAHWVGHTVGGLF